MRRVLQGSTVGLAVFMLAAATVSASILYQDDFSGSSGADLNGTAPDIGAGTWLSDTDANSWKADGSNAGGDSESAFLAFAPVAGKIYTLTVNMNVDNDEGKWFAMGFAKTYTVDKSHASGSTIGTAWMLYKGADTTAPQQEITTFLGGATATTGGVGYNFEDQGDVELKVVLDTTDGGTGAAWDVEWFFQGNSIRTAANSFGATGASGISYVGISAEGSASGVVHDMTLEVIPEPATLGLLGLSAAALIGARRFLLV